MSPRTHKPKIVNESLMQHDRVLKKVEFWPFDPTPLVHPGGESQAFDRKWLLIAQFKYLTFDLT